MKKNILITGATDGIGLETAKVLAAQGHHLLLHGRNPEKLEETELTVSKLSDSTEIESYVAELSNMDDVKSLAKAVIAKHTKLDVLINNAGVYSAPNNITQYGLDIRFVVNTIAPYLLTKMLLPQLGTSGRVINVASAGQAPVNPKALIGKVTLSDDYNAYAQSKLATIMWSRHLALSIKNEGPVIISVNPGSMLGSKMVKQAFGVAGHDIRIGADILTRAALSDDFSAVSGQYFDNDSGRFASPHADALDQKKSEQVVQTIEAILDEQSSD